MYLSVVPMYLVSRVNKVALLKKKGSDLLYRKRDLPLRVHGLMGEI